MVRLEDKDNQIKILERRRPNLSRSRKSKSRSRPKYTNATELKRKIQ